MVSYERVVCGVSLFGEALLIGRHVLAELLLCVLEGHLGRVSDAATILVRHVGRAASGWDLREAHAHSADINASIKRLIVRMIEVRKRAAVVDHGRVVFDTRLPDRLHAVAAANNSRICTDDGFLLGMERLV